MPIVAVVGDKMDGRRDFHCPGRPSQGHSNVLPVLQATKFDLVVNLTTAKALGLAILASFLSLADELLE